MSKAIDPINLPCAHPLCDQPGEFTVSSGALDDPRQLIDDHGVPRPHDETDVQMMEETRPRFVCIVHAGWAVDDHLQHGFFDHITVRWTPIEAPKAKG